MRLDNGCQPTSNRFQDTLKTCGVNPEWIGYNSPKQNAHVERVIGTLKADWLWLEECDTFAEAHALVTRAVREYNEEHPHAALAFLSPDEYRQAYYAGQIATATLKTNWRLPQKLPKFVLKNRGHYRRMSTSRKGGSGCGTRKRRNGNLESDTLPMSSDLYQDLSGLWKKRTLDEWVFLNPKTGTRYMTRPKIMGTICSALGFHIWVPCSPPLRCKLPLGCPKS